MKKWVALLAAVLAGQLFSLSAFAGDEENKLMAVFFGRLSSHIEFPDRTGRTFVITLIDENPFGNLLDDLYKDKTIDGKPVEIRHVTKVEDIGHSDILFVTQINPQARQAIIDYAQNHSILTISHANGFAEHGGIIQLDFVQQHMRIKINQDAAVKSNIRIDAPLLSLATVIGGETP
jgi:hypothetical protein